MEVDYGAWALSGGMWFFLSQSKSLRTLLRSGAYRFILGEKRAVPWHVPCRTGQDTHLTPSPSGAGIAGRAWIGTYGAKGREAWSSLSLWPSLAG